MMILRLFGKLLAVIGIIILSGLCLGVKVIENVGARIAGVAITILGILAIMAVVSSNWFALTVFVILAIVMIAGLFGTATLEVIMVLGRAKIKKFLKEAI